MSQQEGFEQPDTAIADETAEPGKTNTGQTGEIKPPTRINLEDPTQEQDESTEEGTGASAGGS